MVWVSTPVDKLRLLSYILRKLPQGRGGRQAVSVNDVTRRPVCGGVGRVVRVLCNALLSLVGTHVGTQWAGTACVVHGVWRGGGSKISAIFVPSRAYRRFLLWRPFTLCVYSKDAARILRKSYAASTLFGRM